MKRVSPGIKSERSTTANTPAAASSSHSSNCGCVQGLNILAIPPSGDSTGFWRECNGRTPEQSLHTKHQVNREKHRRNSSIRWITLIKQHQLLSTKENTHVSLFTAIIGACWSIRLAQTIEGNKNSKQTEEWIPENECKFHWKNGFRCWFEQTMYAMQRNWKILRGIIFFNLTTACSFLLANCPQAASISLPRLLLILTITPWFQDNFWMLQFCRLWHWGILHHQWDCIRSDSL